MSQLASSDHRLGDWLQTYSGRPFWPLDPRSEDVEIQTIAHALSLQCRYGGHCIRFYSVAEHSVLLSEVAPPPYRLAALLHDAAEAYMVDVPRPLKLMLNGYAEAEDAILAVIGKTFGVTPDEFAAVREIDKAILGDEVAQNLAPSHKPWSYIGRPLGVRLHCWSPVEAEQQFLHAFDQLTKPISK
ncbi:phosphohydrolase [Rhodopseudomonas telluris]|uniref:Phosphohydrolase n=1 Tax=Rhodopseudomonas telluris TaxID=644215 RepID=A0ABV6F0M0_9BRAD